MSLAQPYYTAAVNVSGAGFDMRINDCPIAAHRKRSISTVVPLNEWIHNGPNQLSVELRPLPRETEVRPNAEFTLEVRVREDRDPTQRFVCELAYRNAQMKVWGQDDAPGQGAHVELAARPDGSLFSLQPVFMQVPFAPWGWRDAPTYRNTPSVRKSLLDEISRLHTLFSRNDLDTLFELCRERSLDWATAYYGDYEDAVAATRSTFESICLEPTFSLQPAITERTKLHVYGHGRLAYLTNHLDESTIYYADQEVSVVGQLKFIFRLNEDRQWVVCR